MSSNAAVSTDVSGQSQSSISGSTQGTIIKANANAIKFQLNVQALNANVEFSLPFFRGDASDNFEVWFKLFQEAIKLFGWTATQKITVLRLVLKESALAMIESARNYTEVETALKDGFFPKAAYTSHVYAMRSIKKKKEESIREYRDRIKQAAEKVNLCSRDSPLTEREILDVFIHGLPREFQDKLIVLGINNLSEAHLAAERLYVHEKSSDSSRRANQTNQNKFNKNQKKHKNNQQSQKNQQKQKPYCSFHKVDTHSTKDCRAAKNQNQSNSNRQTNNALSNETNDYSNISLPPQGTQYAGYTNHIEALPTASVTQIVTNARLPIGLNDTVHSALLDTGSTISLIDFNLAKQLKLPIQTSQPMVIQSASHHALNHRGLILIGISLPTLSNSKRFKAKFHVVIGLAAKIILGLDFLTTHKFSMDFGSSTLSYKMDAIEPSADASVKETESFTESPADDPIFDSDTLFTMSTTSAQSPSLQNLAITQEEYVSWYKSFTQKFHDLLGSETKLGTMIGTSFKINVEPTMRPFHFKPFRVPFSQHEQSRAELNKLQSLGVIRPSTSPYASAAFTVPKRDGGLRLVVDFRHLNKHTILDYYPIPNQQDLLLLFSLDESIIFSQLDFNSGYFQILLHPESSLHHTIWKI